MSQDPMYERAGFNHVEGWKPLAKSAKEAVMPDEKPMSEERLQELTKTDQYARSGLVQEMYREIRSLRSAPAQLIQEEHERFIDSAWIDGAKCGFNLGIADDRAGLHAVISARQKDIAESRAQPVSAPAQPEHANYMQIVKGSGVCFAHGPHLESDLCPQWPKCATDPQKPEYLAMAGKIAQPEPPRDRATCWVCGEKFCPTNLDEIKLHQHSAQPEQADYCSTDETAKWLDQEEQEQSGAERARETPQSIAGRLFEDVGRRSGIVSVGEVAAAIRAYAEAENSAKEQTHLESVRIHVGWREAADARAEKAEAENSRLRARILEQAETIVRQAEILDKLEEK